MSVNTHYFWTTVYTAEVSQFCTIILALWFCTIFIALRGCTLIITSCYHDLVEMSNLASLWRRFLWRPWKLCHSSSYKKKKITMIVQAHYQLEWWPVLKWLYHDYKIIMRRLWNLLVQTQHFCPWKGRMNRMSWVAWKFQRPLAPGVGPKSSGGSRGVQRVCQNPPFSPAVIYFMVNHGHFSVN